MSECLFCDIAAGTIPAAKVYETEAVIGFEDINPQAPVHVLFIPREHVASAAEIDAAHGEVLVELFQAAGAHARETGIADGGYRIVTNIGDDAGQSVHHLHLHLIGGRQMGWPPG